MLNKYAKQRKRQNRTKQRDISRRVQLMEQLVEKICLKKRATEVSKSVMRASVCVKDKMSEIACLKLNHFLLTRTNFDKVKHFIIANTVSEQFLLITFRFFSYLESFSLIQECIRKNGNVLIRNTTLCVLSECLIFFQLMDMFICVLIFSCRFVSIFTSHHLLKFSVVFVEKRNNSRLLCAYVLHRKILSSTVFYTWCYLSCLHNVRPANVNCKGNSKNGSAKCDFFLKCLMVRSFYWRFTKKVNQNALMDLSFSRKNEKKIHSPNLFPFSCWKIIKFLDRVLALP